MSDKALKKKEPSQKTDPGFGSSEKSSVTGTDTFSDTTNSMMTESGITGERTSITTLGELRANRIPGRIVPILQVTAGADPGRILSLAQYRHVTLGRGKQCEMIVYDPSCSRQHAEAFVKENGQVYIKDLNSTNGTKINGKPLSPDDVVLLKDGDRVQLGENTILKFSLLPEDDANMQISVYFRATRDSLTNAFNRHQFEESLDREVSYQKRAKHGLAVIIFDVDHFKKVNDSLGHGAGDAVLKEIGARIPRVIRAEDIFARLGGEEFAVLARSENLIGVQILAERIRTAMSDKIVEFEGKQIEFTVSVGVAYITGANEQPGSYLVSQADEALYEAKNGGRNKSVIRQIK
jgi:two-component system cell cycle response regulator